MKILISVFCIATACYAASVPKTENDATSMYLSQFREDADRFATNASDSLSGLTWDPTLIKVFFYSRTTTGGKEINILNPKEVNQTDYSPSKQTIFITHGWINDHRAPMCQKVKDAYIAAGDVNVFVVDWGRLSFEEYVLARNQVVQIGKVIANFIAGMVNNKLLIFEKATFVGHSLGAHIAGTTGKALNKKLGKIVGLDPAGPLFFIKVERDRLDKTDANFVQVIHTCAGRLGFQDSLGHADYWPNGGENQPGCPGIDAVGTCNHALSFEYFAESVRTGKFKAWNCSNYKDFENHLCKNNHESYFGQLALDKKASGNYYLETNAKSPYAKGDKY